MQSFSLLEQLLIDMVGEDCPSSILSDMRWIKRLLAQLQWHNKVSLLYVILEVIVDLILASVEIHDQGAIKDFELLDSANILYREIIQVVLLRFILIYDLLQSILSANIYMNESVRHH